MRYARRVAVAIYLLALLPCSAFARPGFLELFTQVYRPAAGTELARARCQTCHTTAGPPELNPYGAAVLGTLDRNGRLTEAGLRGIEGEDANGDGAVNGVEIAAGRLPGNPAVRVETPAVGAEAEGETAHTRGLLPEHTLHPLVVHFPIALLILGALLDIAGARLRRTDLRTFGFLNFAIGSWLAPISAATGIAWTLRAGFPVQGLLLVHLACAAATILSALSASVLHSRSTRAGREVDSPLYWALIGATMVFAGATAHSGSLMAHGW